MSSETAMKPFNVDDHNFLQEMLTIVMREARNRGDEAAFSRAASLSSRIEQHMMAGEGMTPELRERYQRRITVAQQNEDSQGAARALRDFIATLIRVEPDPAKAVANVCMTAMMRANMGQAAGIFIPLMQKKLVGLQTDYEREGYPSSEDVLNYLHEWLKYGQANLMNGEEPWPQDEHFEEGS
jgi:hypothetical protein